MSHASLKIVLCTGLALCAFAGNSILCRLALGGDTIDAASFTAIRLLSGIIVLLLLVALTRRDGALLSYGSWRASAMLFFYALAFSWAYTSLDTGIGALVLFGAVQITMIVASLIAGNKLLLSEWAGVVIAFSGFVVLVLPDLTTPSLLGFILMTLAGIAWGIYTLLGRGATQPLNDTAANFIRTLPFVGVLIAVSFQHAHVSQDGVLLAVLSGGLASGLGYAIWYIALGGISITQAAVVQLIVPVIAALGGVLFAGELITMRLVLSSAMILGGIMVVVMGRYYFVLRAESRV
ncbi:MAG: EamA family transporter [Gammaproteobacteria bacterium]|nr:MAG: EamA family transporter [Gammaproteobacteria bacterium]